MNFRIHNLEPIDIPSGNIDTVNFATLGSENALTKCQQGLLKCKISLYSFLFTSLFILGVFIPTNISARTIEDMLENSATDTVIEDLETNPIAIYAEGLGISYEEASNRLIIQDEFTDLVAEIVDKEPTFAGSWIDHEPEFRLVVSFTTPNGQKKLRKYLQGVAWSELVSAEQSTFSIGEIKSIQNHLRKIASDNDLRFSSGFNQRERVIKLYTTNPDELSSQLESIPSLKKHLDLFSIEYREPEQSLSNLRGGVGLHHNLNPGISPTHSCTAGLIVVHQSSNRRYITTAGHCANNLYALDGSSFKSIGPVVDEEYNASNDIQMHDAESQGWTLTNQIWAGFTHLNVVDYELKMDIQGRYVAKRGATTGFSIGLVTNIMAAPTINGVTLDPVFVEATRPSWWYPPGPMACPGDSGAPVYMTYAHLSWQNVGAAGIIKYGRPGPCTVANSTYFGFVPIDTLLSMTSGGAGNVPHAAGYRPLIVP